jgi:tetratricopeptide (TPR) repeat protein
MERARQAIEDAAAMDHSLTLCVALILCISLFFWSDDLESAERHIDWLISRSETYSLAPYLLVGRGFKIALAIRRGDANGEVENLKRYLEDPYHPRYPLFSIVLAQGLAAIDRFAEGIALIDESIRQFDASGDLHLAPELLRVKGGILLSMPQPDREGAEECLKRSIELSRRQGARAWELRTATDLAKLWAGQGRTEDARALLQPVFEQFVEGLDTPDLKAAERLLKTLS